MNKRGTLANFNPEEVLALRVIARMVTSLPRNKQGNNVYLPYIKREVTGISIDNYTVPTKVISTLTGIPSSTIDYWILCEAEGKSLVITAQYV